MKYIADAIWYGSAGLPRRAYPLLRLRSSSGETPFFAALRSWKSALAEMFNEFVLHIRKHGYADNFMGQEYTYFNVGDYRYWSMGAPLKETILINRVKLYL